MEIAMIADDSKKELLTQFCIAYCGILSKHNICATNITGKYVSDATGLQIERLLAGSQGGVQAAFKPGTRELGRDGRIGVREREFAPVLVGPTPVIDDAPREVLRPRRYHIKQ